MRMTAPHALRGEIWLVELDHGRGHEQHGTRPVLVISDDAFSSGPSNMAVVAPLTRTVRRNWLHVEVPAGEGGTRADSVVRTDQIRAISRTRFLRRWGSIEPQTMSSVEQRLRVLLDLVD